MPTYDYHCPEGHRFEVFQKMSDDPVAECPECGKKAKRLISGGAGFLFKGEGFYITDYRSEDYKKKASAEPGAATKSGSAGSEGGSGGSGGEGGSGGASKGSEGSSKGSESASKGSESASKGSEKGSGASKRASKADS